MSTRRFSLRPHTVHEKFGDETVIVNLDTGTYYSTQATGTYVWNLVATGILEPDIISETKTSFSGSPDEIELGIAKFIGQLIEESLIEEEHVEGSGKADIGIGSEIKVFSAPVLQKYTDMEEMLLLDPIHEVDEHGWPSVRKPNE